jgi:hypothetical protein
MEKPMSAEAETETVSAEFAAVWQAALDDLTATLDLTDPDDRALLRSFVERITKRATLAAMNEIADLISAPRSRSRADAVRSISGRIIERSTP